MLCPDMENSPRTDSLGQLSWEKNDVGQMYNVPLDNSGSLWHRSGVSVYRLLDRQRFVMGCSVQFTN